MNLALIALWLVMQQQERPLGCFFDSTTDITACNAVIEQTFHIDTSRAGEHDAIYLTNPSINPIDPPIEPMDVPAVRMEIPPLPTCQRSKTRGDVGVLINGRCYVLEMPPWTCADKSRVLLTAEDGTKHCIKFEARGESQK